jgi:hypothetical protein
MHTILRKFQLLDSFLHFLYERFEFVNFAPVCLPFFWDKKDFNPSKLKEQTKKVANVRGSRNAHKLKFVKITLHTAKARTSIVPKADSPGNPRNGCGSRGIHKQISVMRASGKSLGFSFQYFLYQ